MAKVKAKPRESDLELTFENSESVKVFIEVNGLSETVLIAKEVIERFGSVEELLKAVRERVERIVKTLHGNEEYKNMLGEGFLRKQIELTLNEKPREYNYEDYEKWCKENNLSYLNKNEFESDPTIAERLRHIIEQKFVINATINQKGGTLQSSRFVIRAFDEKCFMILGVANVPKNISGTKDPLKYKLLTIPKGRR